MPHDDHISIPPKTGAGTRQRETRQGTLIIEEETHVAFLGIHHPEKRNALTTPLLEALYEELENFSKSGDIRCVVIHGTGDQAFSSGYDIGAIPVSEDRDQKQKPPDILLKTLNRIKNYPYPTIAMINGDTFGAGFNLCACCDIRIAADRTRMAMTPARLGVAYHPEGVLQFINAFGMATTREIFYTAAMFTGKDLLVKGMVHHLIPGSELESFTRDYAQSITRNAPLSLKGIKKIIAMFENRLTLGPGDMEKADGLIQACFASDDLKEGRAAFLEKRSPRFRGK